MLISSDWCLIYRIMNFSCSKIKANLLLILVILSVCIYCILNTHQWTWYNNRKPLGDLHYCETPQKEMNDLKNLIRDVHLALLELQLTHILIYGSLWGALRYKEPLPWDNDVDMALLEDEMNQIDVKTLRETFSKHNIDIYYRMWFGTYRVSRDKARGDLMVFRKTKNNLLTRTGLESWFFFLNYRRYHTFPASLFDKPLPTLPFADVSISVPRNGIEIQKYFYPNDWWKETKPYGCS